LGVFGKFRCFGWVLVIGDLVFLYFTHLVLLGVGIICGLVCFRCLLCFLCDGFVAVCGDFLVFWVVLVGLRYLVELCGTW